MIEKIETTKQIVYQAGALIRDLMKQELHVENKSRKDWVTNIDIQTEAYLVGELKKAFPHTSFLTEENTVDFELSDGLWIIDPIDGTSNLIHQKEYFAISLAYFENKKPGFGIVYNIMSDEFYLGVKDQGASLNGQALSNLDPEIRVENSLLLGNITREGLFQVDLKEILEAIPTYRYLGSGALDTCKVALGQASAYVFPVIKIWDIAASLIILNEVGGTFLLGDGIDEYIFDQKSHPLLACSNKAVLNKLISWT